MLRSWSTALLAFILSASVCLAHGQVSDRARPSNSSAAPSDAKQPGTLEPAAPIPRDAPRISRQTRLEIIRDFETQLVYARTAFPMGTKGLHLREKKN